MATLNTLTCWINAFIPDPSLTRFVVPAPGASTGLSMITIPTPTGTRAFLGDNRGFSLDVSAPARIHSLVEISGLDAETPVLQTVDNKCGESVEIEPTSGEVLQRGTAPTDRISFQHLRANMTVDPDGGVIEDSPDTGLVQIDYEAAANLPLMAGTPDIDIAGTLGIDRDAGTVRFRGAVDGFPAFEAYVSFNLGPPVTLFTMLPVAPIFLIGDANRQVDVTVPIVLPD
jgi:hypothetical protein